MKHPIVRVATALCLSAPLLAAQSGFQTVPPMILDPDWGDLGGCIEVEHGHVFGTLGEDALLLFEGGPVVYKQPEVYRAPVRLFVAANDVAVYPRFPAAPDWIYVAGPNGLLRFTWDGAQFVEDSSNPAGSVWIGARCVGVADLDGQGNRDLYGLDATRTKVILCRNAANPWGAPAHVTFSEPIQSVVPVQWNGVRYQELAVRTSTGLAIINYQAQLLASFVVPPSNGPLRTVLVPGTTREELLVPSGSGASESVRVIGIQGESQVLPLSFESIAGLGIGDLDLDGDADFVLSHRSAPTLELYDAGLVNGLLHFDPDLAFPSIQVEDWFDALLNQASPGVADFDHDGDQDVLFAPVGCNRVDLFGNQLVDDDMFMSQPISGSMTLEPAGGCFHITMEVPPAATAGAWTDLEVVVWRQPRFDYLVESTPFIAPTYRSFAGLTEFTFDVQTPYFEWFEDLFHLEVHLVQRVNGERVAEGPGMTAAVGLQQPLMALGELEGIVGHGEIYGITFEVPEEFEYPDGGGGGPLPLDPLPVGTPDPRDVGNDIEYVTGTWGGGSGCLPDIPDFHSGQPPQP